MKNRNTTTPTGRPDTGKLETGVLGTMRRLGQVIKETEALTNAAGTLMPCRIKPEREDLQSALEHMHNANDALGRIITVRIGQGRDVDGLPLLTPPIQSRPQVNGRSVTRSTDDRARAVRVRLAEVKRDQRARSLRLTLSAPSDAKRA